MAPSHLRTMLSKFDRDSHLPWQMLLRRSLRYAWEIGSARLYLRAADAVGPHARTLGRPRIENLGRIEIGSHVLVRSVNVPVELATGPRGLMRLGNGVHLNYGVSVHAEHAITIGDRVRVGPYAMIVDTDFHDPYVRSRRSEGRAVVIEDDVWIGAKASILKGVRIGRGAIVGTGAVVTRSVPAFSIVAGVPARPVAALDPERFVVEDVA